MAESIQHSVVYKAKAKRLYDILLDSKEFAAFTGGREANIEPTPGGAFSMFGGHITGRNVELVPSKRIVQAWRSKTWPEGAYSIVRFDLVEDGAATTLALTHNGYPEDQGPHLANGWRAQYFDPLRAYLA